MPNYKMLFKPVITSAHRFRRAMIDNNIDLWICPSAIGPAPKGLESTGDPVMNLPWTQAVCQPSICPQEKMKMDCQWDYK